MSRGLWIGGLMALALAVVGASTRGGQSGVAPWDVPDGPNPHPGAPVGAPLLGDPPELVRATGNLARLADGTTVELVSVGRALGDPSGETPADARPVWRPDGAPLYGGRASGSNYMARLATTLENKGARYLEFRVSPPTKLARAEETTVTGYVPDGARAGTPQPELHGWDVIDRLWMPQDGAGVYRTCVVVDERSASRYRFALARGGWSVERTVPIVATDTTDALLAQGSWGKLRRVAPPKESRGPRRSSLKRTAPLPTFVVDPPSEPSPLSYRIRLVDAQGRDYAHVGSWTKFSLAASSARFKSRAAVKVEVSTKSYEWVEFSGVHYDPDRTKWAKGYWGEEGEGAVSRAGGTSLQALIRPVPNEFSGWDPGEVYAPDGKIWRAHPSRAAISPSFSGGVGYEGRLVAGFELEPDRVSDDRPARIEAFASTSPTPGRALGASLAKSAWSTRSASQVMFPRPDSLYVQFAIRYASDRWTKVGEFPAPQAVFPLIAPEERAAYDRGSVLDTAFSVSLRSTGVASLFWHGRGERIGYPTTNSREALVTWPRDDEARVIARLWSGRRVILSPSSFGTSNDGSTAVSVGFNNASDSDPLYSDANFASKDRVRVRYSYVQAFEIETRGYGDPVYVVAKLP